MSNNRPDIRFNNFSEEWEEVTLGEVAIVNPQTDIPSDFNYVDLGSVKGTQLLSYRMESKRTAPSRAQRLASKGDIFYQTVRPYQKNNYLYDKQDDNFVFSTGYSQIRTSVYNQFIYNQLQTDKFVDRVLEKCTGTSYPSINSKDLKKIDIHVAKNSEEQRAVGNTLNNINKLCILESQKLTKLKQFKQSMLQKLFPLEGQTDPEIRFQGFSGEWEQVTLGELGSLISGVGFPESEQNGKNGIPFYKVSDMNLSTNTIKMNLSNNYVNEAQIIIRGWSPIQKVPAILFAKVGAALLGNRKRLVEEKFIIDNNMMAFTIEKTDKYFTYYTFQTIYLPKHAQIGALPSFNASDIAKIELAIPSLPEQQAIGSFFNNLDKHINAQEQKLTKIKQFKQSLLQKMFI